MAFLERYVLQILKDNIFSYQRISAIMKVINRYAGYWQKTWISKTQDIEAQLEEIAHTRENILKAIESGIVASHFSVRLDELKAQEEHLHSELIIANQPQSFYVTEKDIKLLINRFNFMMKEYDALGLRKIILDFVKCITVTDEKIDVSLKISFGDVSIEENSLLAVNA